MIAPPLPKHLRFLTLNLWGDNGPWQSRLGVVARELEAVQPDVVALQEVREVPGRVPNQAETLARARGWHHVFAPSTAWGGGHEGLAVVSRFPIGASDVRVLPHSLPEEGRIVLSARVETPLGSIWVHTTHLSFREHEGTKREDQVMAVDEVVEAHKRIARPGEPPVDNPPQVVMGDFNAVPGSDEIRWLCGLTSLGGRRVFYQDAWEVANPGQPGWTWARANPYTDKMYWLRADRRLDYIFVTAPRRDRRGTVNGARLLFDAAAAADGGASVHASDHYGVVADVQFQSDPLPGAA